MPRSTSSFLVPRSSTPTLSPAFAESSSLRNISMSVATVLRVSFKPDDFDFVHALEHAAFDTAGHHGAATFNVEHVFDAHQERLVHFARRQRNEGVNRVQQFLDGLLAFRLARQRLLGAAADDRGLVARKLILGQQVADFHLDQVQQFRVVHQVNLVQENHDGRHADLAGEQHVLACVWGIGPSEASTTRIAPSICAAPVIMFLM